MFAINTKAPFFLMQDTVKIMIREEIFGSIVNIGSTSALTGQPFIAPYSASKGALATITRNSGYALLRNRIRVNQLNIGWMASEGEDRIQKEYHGASDDWLSKAAEEQPFGRLLDPGVSTHQSYFLSAPLGLSEIVLPAAPVLYPRFGISPTLGFLHSMAVAAHSLRMLHLFLLLVWTNHDRSQYQSHHALIF